MEFSTSELIVYVYLSLYIGTIIHEFGHFAVARLCGFTVDEFVIGPKSKRFSFKRKDRLYNFHPLPLGGHIHLDIKPLELSRKQKLHIALLCLAGPFLNLFTGILPLFFGLTKFNFIFFVASFIFCFGNLMPFPGNDGLSFLAYTYHALFKYEQKNK